MNIKIYSTQKLEQHIKKMYSKVEEITKHDVVYQPLDVKFERVSTGSPDGEYCYSDKQGYHYCCLERGNILTDIITDQLFEITYRVIVPTIAQMSCEYERKNRILHQDNRRLVFSKRLEYFEPLGKDYVTKAKEEVKNILQKAPFQDELY